MEGAYPHTYPQTCFPQYPPVEGGMNSWPSDFLPLAFPQNLEDSGEAYQVFPFIRPSDSMYQMTFPCFNPLAAKSEAFRAAADGDPTLVDEDATRDSSKGHMPMNTSLDDQSHHQCAPVDMANNFSASPIFPAISSAPIAAQSQQQRASQVEPRRSQISRRRHASTTSRPYRRRTGILGTPKRPYSCDICGKAYAQPQGVTRHHREVHQVSVCVYCDDFSWGRPYQLRKHLKEQHPNVNPDDVLGGPIGSRRKVTQISKFLPPQRVSTLEHDLHGRDEPRLCPQAPLPSDVVEAALLSPLPEMSSLDYDPQPEPVEPMTQGPEDPCDLYIDASHIGAADSSTYEFARQTNELETASQIDQIWYQDEGHSAYQYESATTNSQSKLYHISQPYPLLSDIMADQSSSLLWLNLLDLHILLHSPMQSMIDPRSLSPRGRFPRRH